MQTGADTSQVSPRPINPADNLSAGFAFMHTLRAEMTLTKAMIVGVALLIETTSAANAQAQYQPSSQYNRNPALQAYPRPQPYSYPEPYPSTQAPSISPPWYYDPYTSGLGPSPNRSNGS